MTMTYENIIKDIKTGKVHPVYFLHGEEPYYIDRIADYIEDNVLTEGEKAFNQVVIYGKDADFRTVVDEARQFPMMSTYRVVLIKEAQDMKSLLELVSYLEKPSSTSILVLCFKYKKLDKRTRFSKLLDEKAVVFESKKIYDNQVAGWARDYLKDLGYTFENGVTELLAEYLGADLNKVSNELDKLAINISKNRTVTLQDVREQIGISKDFDVFEFQKLLGEKNFVKAFRIVNYFSQNPNANPAVMIISSVFGYFNKVMITKYHSSLGDQELAKLAGVSPFFLKEYRAAAKNYTFEHLIAIFKALKTCDKSSKGIGNRGADDGTILKDLLISCMQPS